MKTWLITPMTEDQFEHIPLDVFREVNLHDGLHDGDLLSPLSLLL
jgi:hypothetical protein